MRRSTPFAVTCLTILSALAPPSAHGQKMYWAKDSSGAGLSRANLDGSGIEGIASGLSNDVCLDLVGGKVYWTDHDDIHRANLDGSEPETVLAAVDADYLALDSSAGEVYWTGAGQIRRADLDGSGVEVLLNRQTLTLDIGLDVINGKMYWGEGLNNGRIMRANLDGSLLEELVPAEGGQRTPIALALDVEAGKMYWAFTDMEFYTYPPVIRRANLDGSAVEEVVSGTGGGTGGQPFGIALDLRAGKVYWINVAAHGIYRANLNGTGVEEVLAVGGSAIAIDSRPANIPTLSTWGLVVLALLLAVAGAMVGKRDRASRATDAFSDTTGWGCSGGTGGGGGAGSE